MCAHRSLYLRIRIQCSPLLIDEQLQFLNVQLFWDMAQLLLNMCLCLVLKHIQCFKEHCVLVAMTCLRSLESNQQRVSLPVTCQDNSHHK